MTEQPRSYWRTAEEARQPLDLPNLTRDSPRLPDALRAVVFEAVFDIVEKFNFPTQNCGPSPDVAEIGDVCGEVEKKIVAILRASKVGAPESFAQSLARKSVEAMERQWRDRQAQIEEWRKTCPYPEALGK